MFRLTEYPTPQKYKSLKLVQPAVVIAFSGFQKMIQADYEYQEHNDITTRLLIISCNGIMLTITTALYAGSVYHVLY